MVKVRKWLQTWLEGTKPGSWYEMEKYPRPTTSGFRRTKVTILLLEGCVSNKPPPNFISKFIIWSEFRIFRPRYPFHILLCCSQIVKFFPETLNLLFVKEDEKRPFLLAFFLIKLIQIFCISQSREMFRQCMLHNHIILWLYSAVTIFWLRAHESVTWKCTEKWVVRKFLQSEV